MTAARHRSDARTVRPVWWQELALVVAVYGLYTLTRNTLPTHERHARANAVELHHLEQHLGIDIERSLNHAVALHWPHWLTVTANYAYSVPHLAVTLGVLVWVFFRRPASYRLARNALLLTTVIGLLGFWLYPLAPPRFLPHLGYIDTVVRDGTWGSWASAAVTSISNQYAAMPSIHQAWSIWVAMVVVLLARRVWVKVVAAVYPLVVFLVIVGTANHWVLDAAGGLAAVGIATAICVPVDRVLRRGHRATPRPPEPSGPMTLAEVDAPRR